MRRRDGGGSVSLSRRSLEDKREHAVSRPPLGGGVCIIKGPLTAERRGAATGNERFKEEDVSLIISVLRWGEKNTKEKRFLWGS